MWELVQQRQRWVRARYGAIAFEDKPRLEGYSSFDFSDGNKSFQEYASLISVGDNARLGFLLDQQEAEHDEQHFLRSRPFCPTCRNSRVIARLSLCSWFVRHPGRAPKPESDAELGWDTEPVAQEVGDKQEDLYYSPLQLSQMRPPHDLIEGIIPTRGVGYITGRDRSLKTFLALDVCLTVACMLPYWHEAPNREADDRVRRRACGFANEGNVLFAAGEGVSSFSPRINAWVKAQHVKGYDGTSLRTADGELSVRVDSCSICEAEGDARVGHVNHVEFDGPDGFDAHLVAGLGQMENENMTIRRGTPNFFAGGDDFRFMLAMARERRPDVIVIDTLALAAGGADQQSAVDMGLIHERAKLMEQASGGVVIIIAHTDKGDNDARGSSVIEDNADFVLHCQRVDNDQLEVKVAKRKDAEDNWSFMLAVESVDLGFGQTSLILKDWDGELYATPDPNAEAYGDVLDACDRLVAASGYNSFQAADVAVEMSSKPRVNISRQVAGGKLEKMVDLGLLQKIPGGTGRGNGHRYYYPKERLDWLERIGVNVRDVGTSTA